VWGEGKAFGNLGTADEAAPAQDERGRGVEGVVASIKKTKGVSN
jgi:hypothetical protein